MTGKLSYNDLVRYVQELEEKINGGQGTEATIHRQPEFLYLVLESLSHPFYVIDVKNYAIILANSAARMEHQSGLSTCYALTHQREVPCHTDEHPCPLEIIKRTQKPCIVEHIHFDDEGRPRNVEVHAYPVFNAKGRLSQMIEYTFDITERKQIENERDQLIKDLQRSLAEVKTLSGMLPICSFCKKIRDDKGYWNQIEAYIHEHSDATFSHGICPDCTQKLYPEYSKKSPADS